MGSNLAKAFAVFTVLFGLLIPVQAQTTKPAATPPAASGSAAANEHRKQDIGMHRTIAAAHEEAARCLESGKPEKQCHEALNTACKGIALGRYCGMKHVH
jgi:hypothetical protein